MRPTLVDSGRQALAQLEQSRAQGEPFALVLLDAHMPEMDGFTLARRIQDDLSQRFSFSLSSGFRPHNQSTGLHRHAT